VPFIADQPFWGRVVHELDAGPKPIPQKKLTVEALSSAISQAANDAGIQHQAEAIGTKIRAEDGVANAIDILKRYI
jgi:sterol 3beta-glucosyltransferase